METQYQINKGFPGWYDDLKARQREAYRQRGRPTTPAQRMSKKSYYERNKERLKDQASEYYYANKDRILEGLRQSYDKKKESIRQGVIREKKRQARPPPPPPPPKPEPVRKQKTAKPVPVPRPPKKEKFPDASFIITWE
jgi:hypothetical protein